MRYRLEIEVGHGRYGRLYRATDLQTGRVVACKRLGETWLAVPDFEERLERLVQSIGRLNHPHIAPLLDVSHELGEVLLVMPWLEAGTAAPHWEAQAEEALAYAHRQGVRHGHLQASNIIHTAQGAILTDFGLYLLDPQAEEPTADQDQQALANLATRPSSLVPSPPSPNTQPPQSAIRIPQSAIALPPSGRADWPLTLTNEGELVLRVGVAVRGLPADWYTLSQDAVQLLPTSEQSITFLLHPPAGVAAGTYPFELVAQEVEGGASVASAVLTIEPVAHFSAQMHPQTLTNRGVCHVQLYNHGNAPATLAVAGRDTAEIAHFSQPETVSLAANESQTVTVHVSADKRPWLGSPARSPFTVQVAPTNGEAQILTGQLSVTPYLPLWIVPVVSVLFLLICTLGLFVGSRYVSRRLDLEVTQTAIAVRLTAAVTPSPTAEPAPTLTRIPTLTPPQHQHPHPPPQNQPPRPRWNQQ